MLIMFKLGIQQAMTQFFLKKAFTLMKDTPILNFNLHFSQLNSLSRLPLFSQNLSKNNCFFKRIINLKSILTTIEFGFSI